MHNRNKHEYRISNACKNGNDVLQEPIIKNSRRGRSVKRPLTSVVRNCVTIFKVLITITL